MREAAGGRGYVFPPDKMDQGRRRGALDKESSLGWGWDISNRHVVFVFSSPVARLPDPGSWVPAHVGMHACICARAYADRQIGRGIYIHIWLRLISGLLGRYGGSQSVSRLVLSGGI